MASVYIGKQVPGTLSMQDVVEKLQTITFDETVQFVLTNAVIKCKRVIDVLDDVSLNTIHIFIDDKLALRVGKKYFYSGSSFERTHIADAMTIVRAQELVDKNDTLSCAMDIYRIMMTLSYESLWKARDAAILRGDHTAHAENYI